MKAYSRFLKDYHFSEEEGIKFSKKYLKSIYCWPITENGNIVQAVLSIDSKKDDLLDENQINFISDNILIAIRGSLKIRAQARLLDDIKLVFNLLKNLFIRA